MLMFPSYVTFQVSQFLEDLSMETNKTFFFRMQLSLSVFSRSVVPFFIIKLIGSVEIITGKLLTS